MSDEVKQAAERLSRIKAGVGSDRIYRDLPRYQYDRDVKTLADAYLASNPADDGEAITQEWWETLKDDPGELYFLHFGDDLEFWLYWSNARGLCVDSPQDSTLLPHIKTRGQLRRLCAALGIELKPAISEIGKAVAEETNEANKHLYERFVKHPTASDQESGK